MCGIDGIGVDRAEPMNESIVIPVFTAPVFVVIIMFASIIVVAVIALVAIVVDVAPYVSSFAIPPGAQLHAARIDSNWARNAPASRHRSFTPR
jgi:hypothetical protein